MIFSADRRIWNNAVLLHIEGLSDAQENALAIKRKKERDVYEHDHAGLSKERMHRLMRGSKAMRVASLIESHNDAAERGN